MEKLLIGGIIGIFIGAFTVEILNRKSPQTVRKIEAQAAKVAERLTAGMQKTPDGTSDAAVEPAG